MTLTPKRAMCSDGGAMTGWTRRLAAAAALSGLLACSGLGMCWTRVVPTAHDCCTSAGGQIARRSRPCAGEASYVKAESLPPSVAPAPMVADLAPPRAVWPGAAFAPAFPVKSPPLVLRI
jgi:hypothetical protein